MELLAVVYLVKHMNCGFSSQPIISDMTMAPRGIAIPSDQQSMKSRKLSFHALIAPELEHAGSAQTVDGDEQQLRPVSAKETQIVTLERSAGLACRNALVDEVSRHDFHQGYC